MNIRNTFCLLALAGVAVLPLAASAAYDSSAGVTGSVNVGGSASGTSAGVEVGADADSSVRSDDTSTDDSGTTSGSAGLTGGLRTNALGIEVVSSGQVQTAGDLEVFSENMRERDENIANANARAAGSADLTYYHKGKLFGLFPVKVKTQTWVTSETDGTVSVNTTLPWWSGFVTGTGKVRSEVDAALANSASLSADMQASADAAARARILDAIASAHAKVDTSATVTAAGE